MHITNTEEKTLNKLCTKIKDGDYAVRFSDHTYSGKSYSQGIYDIFSVENVDGTVRSLRIGKICLGEGDLYHVSFSPMASSTLGYSFQAYFDKNNQGKTIFNEAYKTIFDALVRDDPKFINGITVNGTKYMPDSSDMYRKCVNDTFYDYSSITRDHVVSGAFKDDLENVMEAQAMQKQNSVFNITFNGKKYPARYIESGDTTHLISVESLNEALMTEDGGDYISETYISETEDGGVCISEEAKNLDETIYCFVPDDKINTSYDELIDFIKTEIDEEMELD